jgi:hypothetical protein
MDGQPVARPLPTQDNINTEYTQTSMLRVAFEPTISAFEGTKTYFIFHKGKMN